MIVYEVTFLTLLDLFDYFTSLSHKIWLNWL